MFYHSKVQYGVPQDSVDLCCSLYITQAYHIIDLYNLMLGYATGPAIVFKGLE